jgi:hypothetical protein
MTLRRLPSLLVTSTVGPWLMRRLACSSATGVKVERFSIVAGFAVSRNPSDFTSESRSSWRDAVWTNGLWRVLRGRVRQQRDPEYVVVRELPMGKRGDAVA